MGRTFRLEHDHSAKERCITESAFFIRVLKWNPQHTLVHLGWSQGSA